MKPTLALLLVLAAGCNGLTESSTESSRAAQNGTPQTPSVDRPAEDATELQTPSPSLPARAHLATVPEAQGLACTASTVYAGTKDGHLFAVDVTSGATTELLPAPGSEVGRLAVDGTSLFYTLPTIGEVHRRDLAGGIDELLASGLTSPTGIAVDTSSVFVGTATTITRLAKTGAAQTPETRLSFAGSSPQRSTILGMSINEGRLFVVHAPPSPGTSTSVGYYTKGGEQLAHYTIMSAPIDVTTSPTMAYFPTSGDIFRGPAPLTPNGWRTEPVAAGGYLYGGVCLSGSRLFYTVLGNNDERAVAFVDVTD